MTISINRPEGHVDQIANVHQDDRRTEAQRHTDAMLKVFRCQIDDCYEIGAVTEVNLSITACICRTHRRYGLHDAIVNGHMSEFIARIRS